MSQFLERLFVALDTSSLAEALALVDELAGLPVGYKVGLELFAVEGPRGVAEVRARGGRVFLDLKLHDIPETVRRAARAAAATGAALLTVHAAGGRAMLEAAVAGAREGSASSGSSVAAGAASVLPAPPGSAKVLAVTVLTSLDVADLAAVGTDTPSVEALVVRRALLARDAGCDGVVASPREAKAVRAAVGPDFLIVTPGVRPSGGALGDQKRVATARAALADGADAVVVGRPIRDASAPRAIASALLSELDSVAWR